MLPNPAQAYVAISVDRVDRLSAYHGSVVSRLKALYSF
jgi:hypothetical protein